MLIPTEISIIVSSDANGGAKNVSSDGSYFEIQLEDGLKIPKEALNVNISVIESSIWWTVPNILTDVNDKLYFNYEGQHHVVIIPQGLYTFSSLKTEILKFYEIYPRDNIIFIFSFILFAFFLLKNIFSFLIYFFDAKFNRNIK